MTPHIIRISINDDFGVTNNSWGPNPTSIRCPDGIKSISGSDAVVDEKILRNINSWGVVSSLMSRNFNLVSSTQEEFQENMSRFGKFEIEKGFRNEYTLNFDNDNAYDLRMARFIDNDTRGKEFNTIDIWYQNNPINYFFIKNVNGYSSIDIGTFSKNYFVYSESDWWTFTNSLENGLSVQEIRDMKITQILNENPNVYTNLIRQLGFRNEYGKNSNRFLSSVYEFYKKNGFITEKQAKAVMREIW